MLLRILTVREHKTVFFCDVIGNDTSRGQLLIEKQRFPDIHPQTGTVFDCDCCVGTSRKGNNVLVLTELNNAYPHTCYSPYKSFQEKSKDPNSGGIHDSLANMLNGGNMIVAEALKNKLLEHVESYLRKRGVHREHTPITTAYRGTSTATPRMAVGQYTGCRYIKITHELGLKMAAYLRLQSVYEIGYVCRERYATQHNLNEFLSIEGVVLLSDHLCLLELFYDIWEKARQISTALNLETNEGMQNLVLVDFIQEFGSVPKLTELDRCHELYRDIVNAHPHLIITNAPTDTPLAYSEEGLLPLETKWIYSGKSIGHGYVDEYRSDKVFKAFEAQKENLKNNNIEASLPYDFLEVLASSGIPTNSFAIGVNRLINCLVNLSENTTHS